jgi:hypothetical protein
MRRTVPGEPVTGSAAPNRAPAAVEIADGRDALAVVNVRDSPRLRAGGNLSRRPHRDARPITWREVRDSARP